MLNKIIDFSLRNPFFILSGVILLVVGGYYAIQHLDIDVFPDLTAPTVVIMTDAGNMATEEVERLVTFPIESAVNGAVDVRRVRSSSTTGTSFVWVEFNWGTDIYRARQITAEKIATLEKSLPEGITPLLAPQSSIMGEVLFVGITADSTPMMELRSLTDWVIKPALLAMGGVAQVTVMGGYYKQYQILADPVAMQAYGVRLDEIADCMAQNRNSAGGVLREYGNEFAVRGVVRTARIDELESSPIKLNNDKEPICVRDVADVKIAPSVKTGFGSINAQPAILMTISKQPDVNTLKVTEALLKRIETLKENLPPDVKLNTEIFRQSDFIEASVNNVGRSLFEGAVFVILILMIFLGSFRTTLISIIAIPLSLLGTVIVLYLTGQNINTMTLGGMCIAIGSLVDDAIIDVENVYKKLRRNHLLPKDQRLPIAKVVYEGSTEIRASILNATFIIIVAFAPLFFLSGMEGRMLKPLGLAYIISLLMSLVVAMTVTPLLCKKLLGNDRYLDLKTSRSRTHQTKFTKFYRQSLLWSLAHKKTVVLTSSGALVLAIAVFFTLGSSFLPDFNEGSLTISAVSKPGVSLEVSQELGNTLERQLLSIEEVISTARRTGRGELDEHAQASNSAEIEVKFLLNKRSKHEFLEEVRAKLAEVPGVITSVGQPLSHRIDHILSGTQANIAIKVFGPDLIRLYAIGHQIQNSIRHIEGVTDLNVEQQTRTPQLQIRANRPMLARYGLTLNDFNRFVETAFPGKKLGDVYEGQRRFDLVLKLKPEYTQDMEGIAKARIIAPDGRPIPLSEVAEIVSTDGPNAISRENVQRKLVVSCNVTNRDMKSVVDEIRKTVAEEIVLDDENYRIEYGGQFESAQSASRTLFWIFLASLLVIFFILYSEFRQVGLACLILVNLPLALIGGVFAVRLSSGVVSIPSIIGFITLFGIAIRNGILLVAEYERLLPASLQPEAGILRQIVTEGSADRLNPILMTALTAALALIPLIFNGDKSGNEIQSPMGIVVLGGLITSTLLNIYVVPALYEWYRGRKKPEMRLPKNRLAMFLPFWMLLLVILPASGKAQETQPQILRAAHYREILDAVDKQSPLLSASRQQRDADLKGNHTGIVPENPEFTFGYYRGVKNNPNPERFDFEAGQSFDFPSVYVHKTRMAKMNDSAVWHRFDADRADVMMQVQSLCMEVIYFNCLQQVLDSCIEDNRQLVKIYREMLEKGETNILEMNRMEFALIDLEKEMANLQSERNQRLMDIKRFTGGLEVDLAQRTFPDFEIPSDFETWFDHVSESNPTLRQMRSEQAARQQNIKVNISESFPRFSIAYKGENVFENEGFNGLAVGMSIPLWENKNKVKQARLEAAAAQALAEDARWQIRARLEAVFDKTSRLQPIVLRYRESVKEFDNRPLVEAAMENGSFSMITYLLEKQYLLEILRNYFEAEKELALSWTELQWLSGASI